MANRLTVGMVQAEAANFSREESQHKEASLFGVTDGKAVGTYLEHKFQDTLARKYGYERGNSASGIDFPSLGLDIKVTSLKQPQSSCPFRSARQKVYGLGYSLIVFVYEKTDYPRLKAATLKIVHTIFVDKDRTADYQTTVGLRKLVKNGANKDDILAFFEERRLPIDEIEGEVLAEEILLRPPDIGYLTISNALQWRLQYGRAIEQAGQAQGVTRLS